MEGIQSPSSAGPAPETNLSPQPVSPRSKTTRRAATLGVDGGKPRRAPSPMGERILKGHFDGFN